MKRNTGKSLKRAAALFLAVLTAVCLPVNAFAIMAPPADVSYYPADNYGESAPWYTEAVIELYYGQGIIWDLMDGEYVHPQKAVTRGEFLQLLRNLAEAAKPGESIPENPLLWAKENGILLGSGNSVFPGRTLTREEMAAALMRFAKYMGLELLWLEEYWEQPAGMFCDAGQISPWAQEGVDYCARTMLLKGRKQWSAITDEETGLHACGWLTYFDPKRTVTRAQVIQAVYNYVQEAHIELEFLNDMPMP